MQTHVLAVFLKKGNVMVFPNNRMWLVESAVDVKNGPWRTHIEIEAFCEGERRRFRFPPEKLILIDIDRERELRHQTGECQCIVCRVKKEGNPCT